MSSYKVRLAKLSIKAGAELYRWIALVYIVSDAFPAVSVSYTHLTLPTKA